MAGIGMIGFGGIARTALAHLRAEGAEPVAGVLVRAPTRAAVEAEGLTAVASAAELAALAPSLVAECAGQGAVAEHGPVLLEAGIDLLVVSVGALADPETEARLVAAAKAGGARILLPAGAIGGIDALAAMRLGGLARVAYRGRKPPAAWAGTPAAETVDLERLTEPAVLYRGTAREAARRFPQNANVAATVALAGLGLDATTVELVADPGVARNIHEIEAEGMAAGFTLRLEGRPSPDNPRTSALTALSVARALLNRRATVEV